MHFRFRLRLLHLVVITDAFFLWNIFLESAKIIAQRQSKIPEGVGIRVLCNEIIIFSYKDQLPFFFKEVRDISRDGQFLPEYFIGKTESVKVIARTL